MTQPINYSKYLPEALRSTDLMEKLVDIINHFTDEERKQFQDVVLKYKDPFNINPEAAENVFKEFGYDYITGMVDTLTSEEMGTLVSFLGLISMLKSHKDGLELIFDLLQFSYDITEWWQFEKDRRKGPLPDSPLLERYEWRMTIDILKSANITNIFKTVPSLRTFVKNYVYPLLVYLELLYDAEMSPTSITAHGAEDFIDVGGTDSGYLKTLSLFTVMDVLVFGSYSVTVDLNDPLFNETLDLENDFNLYLENGDILKLEG